MLLVTRRYWLLMTKRPLEFTAKSHVVNSFKTPSAVVMADIAKGVLPLQSKTDTSDFVGLAWFSLVSVRVIITGRISFLLTLLAAEWKLNVISG